MKAVKYLGVTTAALFAIAASTVDSAHAQAAGPALEITPFVGGALFTGDLHPGSTLKHGVTVGGNLGVRFANNWGVEGTFAWSPSEIDAGSTAPLGGEVSSYLYSGNLNYFVPVANPRIEPYLSAGAGAKTYSFDLEGIDNQTNFAGNVGAGLRIAATPQLGLRFDVRNYMSRFEQPGFDSEFQNDVMLTAGLSWRTR